MNALIVDDSRAMRRILRGIVTQLGFDVIEASNGAEGYDKLVANEDIELVLVDWNMPVMNGIELVKKVRSEPRYETLKMVMVTTETEPQQMARAIMAGVDEFVMKPFTSDILIDKFKLIGVRMPQSS
ncbi:MAG: response regulator [Planctomycetales bacterium]|nr:response regulator [Planctomycetales bacterium]